MSTLPRLKQTDVLLGAIREGVETRLWPQETFAYADSYDEGRNRYLGLKVGQQVSVLLNASSVLVKPDVAAAQIAADTAPVAPTNTSTAMTYTRNTSRPKSSKRTARHDPGDNRCHDGDAISASAISTRQAKIAPLLWLRHDQPPQDGKRIWNIMQEVVQHLTALYGANVQVTLEIQANAPNGIPSDVVNTLKENCRSLRFESFGLEEE